MRVLYITSEWPTAAHRWAAPFLVRQVNALRQAGVDVDVFPFRGGRRLANYGRIYRRLHQQLKERPYDLAHAQFGHSAFLAAVPKRIPLVVTFQGSDLQGIYTAAGRYHPISYPFRLAMQFVAYRADAVVLVSRHMSRFLWRRDYHVIPGGIDLTLFKPMPQAAARQQLGLPLAERLVLFVGSSPVKRFHLAQTAVSMLPADVKARLLPLTTVSPEQVPVYMNAADVMLVTSKHEGSPNAVKEAMACCLPIVTLDVGDVRERLADVEGCAIVSSEEAAVIAQHLAESLRQRRRTNGWEVAQALDEARLAQRQIEVYNQVMGCPRQ